MKRLTSILAIAVALAFPNALINQAAAQPPPPPKPPGHEHHPDIHKAIAALEAAKHYMEHADHDFSGHRVEALKATDVAIQQLRLAIQSDRR